MSGWVSKRFWTDVAIREVEAGYAVELDGRPVRTPAKAALTLPTRALAEAVAEEWRAQQDEIQPEAMPVTRMANSSIDKIIPQRAEVEAHLLSYGETDLLCYRAESPQELVDRQAEAWDPWLEWLAQKTGVRLLVASGVIPVAQPLAELERLKLEFAGFSNFQLAAFHDLVTLPGSLVLAISVTSGSAKPNEIWDVACVDEQWQIEQWGEDEEAQHNNILKRKAFLDAASFFEFARELR